MIDVELVGGPEDGLVIRIDSHRCRWLFPRPSPSPCFRKVEEVRPEPMHVAVYEKIPGRDKYRFYKMEIW